MVAREALAEHVNQRPGARVTPRDIIFFNGVADAVAKVYGFLSAHARVIGPSPAYSTHSSAESAHCALPHITYDLDPENGWMPDLADLRRKIESYPSIAGILIINPNNPTGAVYPPEMLEEIVGARPGVRPVHHRRRDLHPHGLPRLSDRAPVRGRHGRAGPRHARHLQGTALAGLALRLDRGAQPGLPTRTSQRMWTPSWRPNGWRSAPPAGRS